MTTTDDVDHVSRRSSMSNSRNGSIICSLSPDVEPFKARNSKSETFDSGQADERSAYIISVQEGIVNTGFVEENTEKDLYGDCGPPRTEGDLSEQLDNSNHCTEAGDKKVENISAEKDEEDKAPTPPETPPDASKKSISKLSTRDYLIAFTVFLLVCITYGNMVSLPVLAVEWSKEFPNSKSLILFVPNLASALMSAIGVIDGFLINQFGIHKIILLGCCLQITSVIGSSFSTNAITLVIVLGFLLGCASCFCYLNSFILMGLLFGETAKYFMAILSLASPICGFIFPNLIPVFIEQYTWKGTMFMLAAIDLQMIPLTLFLFLSNKNKKKKHPKIDARKINKKKTTEADTLSPPKKTFDLSLFKNPLYVAYLCAVFFTLSGIMGCNNLLPSFLHSKNLTLHEAAEFYSIYRVVAVLPRGSIAFIQRWIKFSFVYIYVLSASVFGLMCILINFAESRTILFTICIILSLSNGAPSGLYPIGILECVGPEKYSFGASIIETSYGIGIAVFGYIAGILVEYMDSYQQIFCIYGGFIITSNLCLLITVLVQNRRGKKDNS